jgi:hypothetical protein
MKTKPSKKVLAFGDPIANFYHAYSKGKGILRLPIKAALVGFHGRNGYVSSRRNGAA